MDLTGIEGASGLSRDEAATLRELLEVARSVEGRNSMLGDYYEGEHVPANIGIDNIPAEVDPGLHVDWARKAVTSVSERVRLDGFAFTGDYKDPALERVVAENDLSNAFNRHVASELTHGCMFATVQRSGGSTAVRIHTAETAAAVWDAASQRIGAGIVVADVKRRAWSGLKPVAVQANMHLPGRVVVLRLVGPAKWHASSEPTPLSRPMMEPLAFRATGTKPFGQTRITSAVRSYVDEVERTLRYMAVSDAFYAVPMMAATGLTDEAYDSMRKSKWLMRVGSWFLATRDDAGDTADVKQFQGVSPQPYIDAIMTYAKLFSGATGVPLNSLGIVQDNPSSAQAIEASREDVCLAAEDCIDANRSALRNVALMAMAVAGNTTIDGLTDEQKSVMPRFKNPMRPSLASTADAMSKIAAAVPEFSRTREYWSGQGFDAAEVESILSQIAGNENRAALMSIMGGEAQPAQRGGSDVTASDAAEVQGKTLNGAQTQSLIAIMSQYSSGAITEGQAARLISTAIGLSIGEAREILNGTI